MGIVASGISVIMAIVTPSEMRMTFPGTNTYFISTSSWDGPGPTHEKINV